MTTIFVRRHVETAQDVRFDASDTVRIRSDRRAAVHRRGARVGVGQRPGRYCGNIRWMQSWIVTTDRQCIERRQHVVRRVEQVDPLAPERASAREPARGPSMAGADSTTARKFGPTCWATSRSRSAAEQDVLGRLIDPRQLVQQVPDVGADAEVVELPGVDRDAHAPIIPGAGPNHAPGAARDRAREPAPHPEVRAQPGIPARVVLPVEGEVAPPVEALSGSRSMPDGAAPQVDDLRSRAEQDATAPSADSRAEVHVFGVQEEALVEQADRLGIRPPDQQACAADPVRVVGTRHAPADPRRHRRHRVAIEPAEYLPPGFADRRDHACRTTSRAARRRQPGAARRQPPPDALSTPPRGGRWRRGAPWCRCSGAGPGCRPSPGCRCCSRGRNRDCLRRR